MRILNSTEDLEKLKQMYNSGISYTILCQTFNVNDKIITKRLKQMGVHVPNKKCLRRKSKYKLNSNYFEKIDTEDKAYFLGFIGADGCVMKDKYGRSYLKFHQHKQDIDILNNFLKYLECDYSIKYDKKRPHIISLCISDKKLISDLIKHGIVYRKSLIYEFNSSLPEELIPHYIRGYMDGDGCVYNFKTKIPHESYSAVGSVPFIRGFVDFLNRKNIFVKYYYCNKNKNAQFAINKLEYVNKFFDIVYKNSKLHGIRKYEIIKQYH